MASSGGGRNPNDGDRWPGKAPPTGPAADDHEDGKSKDKSKSNLRGDAPDWPPPPARPTQPRIRHIDRAWRPQQQQQQQGNVPPAASGSSPATPSASTQRGWNESEWYSSQQTNPANPTGRSTGPTQSSSIVAAMQSASLTGTATSSVTAPSNQVRPSQSQNPPTRPFNVSAPPATIPANIPVNAPSHAPLAFATSHGAQRPQVSFADVLESMGLQPTEKQSDLTPEQLMYEYGLRTGFGSRNDHRSAQGQAQAPKVITNYVDLKKMPEMVYVYVLEIVRETKDGKKLMLKNKAEWQAFFEALKQRPQYMALGTSSNYVTDHDLIWAKSPLFFPQPMDVTPPAATQVNAQHPQTQANITAESVRIRFDRLIPLNQSLRRLCRSRNASTSDSDDPSILTRGINAFMSQYARDNMDPNGYASTSANKFFLTTPANQHQMHLDGHNPPALRALRSFSLSMRPGTDRMLLNIHVGASPFLENVKVQALLVAFRRCGLTPREAFSALKGKEVKIEVPNHASRIGIITEFGDRATRDALTWLDVERLPVNMSGGQTLDMLVNVGPKESLSLQLDRVKASHMTIHGFNAFRGVMAGEQTSKMLEFACRLPPYNQQLIERDGMPLFGMTPGPARNTAFQYDMETEQQLLRVPGRWLTAPKLRYSGPRPTETYQASWDLRNCRFFQASLLENLLKLDLSSARQLNARGPKLDDLDRAIRKSFQDLGIMRSTAQIIAYQPPANPHLHEGTILEYFSRFKGNPAPMLVILPQQSFDIYSTVKRVADLQLGQHAVCAVADKLSYAGRPDKNKGTLQGLQTVANIAMKFNLKGTGINHVVEDAHLASILNKSQRGATIIIGADVAHSTSSAKPGCPSIAAVVGSVDDNFAHYPGSMRLQISRQEYIEDLRDMVKERLIDWAGQHDGNLPMNMLFYRDGVSESQYDAVRTREIPQLQGAFDDAHEYLSKQGGAGKRKLAFNLTFVVVGKRHNTRFFVDSDPASQQYTFTSKLTKDESKNQDIIKGDKTVRRMLDRNRQPTDGYERVNCNVLPGFVIDDVITHPYSNDFFLQSHKPLQGTGRSAHYFVLTNQMRLGPDDLQRVTHALCYIYARATKGVSYCAPAYYADRLCDRGRAWFRDYLMGRQGPKRNKDEDFDKFKQRFLEEADQSPYWRPQRPADRNGNAPDPNKYGQPRKNPWHPNLDNVMFYL